MEMILGAVLGAVFGMLFPWTSKALAATYRAERIKGRNKKGSSPESVGESKVK